MTALLIFVVLEVDENQHRERACECEQARMLNITYALGMPTIFVRYNPDSFKDSRGRKVEMTDNKRHNILIKWLKFIMDSPPQNMDEYLRVLYICYDDFDEKKFDEQLFNIDIKIIS